IRKFNLLSQYRQGMGLTAVRLDCVGSVLRAYVHLEPLLGQLLHRAVGNRGLNGSIEATLQGGIFFAQTDTYHAEDLARKQRASQLRALHVVLFESRSENRGIGDNRIHTTAGQVEIVFFGGLVLTYIRAIL